VSAILKVHYCEGLLFQKFTVLSNPKADPNPNLNPTLALWHVSAQWTFRIADLRNSGPSE